MQQAANSTGDFDILVVGGGMVGATMACLLGDKDLRVGLLDANPVQEQHKPFLQSGLCFDPRVSAIAPASRELFSALACWETMCSARVSPYTRMQVWDGDGTGHVHFSAADIHADELGHIVENSVILHGLYQSLASRQHIQLLPPAAVASLEIDTDAAETRVLVGTDSGIAYRCALLLGADGANSRVRELAGLRTREWDYEHQAIVTTVRTELPHQATAWQRFMDTGPLAFLPLSPACDSSDQHYCSIVWSCIPSRAEELMSLNDAEFAEALQQAIESRFGRIAWVDKRFSFPLRQRHALDYVQEGVALLGDAAHTIHPLAGQGVNLGLADARVLAEEIGNNLRSGRPVNELAMLRRYQRRRVGHNLGMMWMIEGFKRLFEQQSLPLRWLRNVGMRGVDQSSLLKSRLIRQATGY